MAPEKKILVIDDSPDTGLFISVLIESAGLAKVSVIGDGLEGLASCFRDPPDVLVLDLNLPTMRGEEILRLLRTSGQHRDLPVLVISAFPEAQQREMEMLSLGADAYMDKPLLETSFLYTVQKLLSRWDTSVESNPDAPQRPDTTASQAFIRSLLDRELADEIAPGKIGAGSLPENRTRVELHPEAVAATVLVPRSPEAPARVFRDYRILGVVGSGGMGTVYKAEQIKLQRLVALKVLLEHLHENHEIRERFQREALIMAQVNHPNIVQVYETGKTAYTSYFAMEFVDGESLAERIRKSTLNWEECPSLIRQTCAAIAHLHSKGIIHRDIKPSNILISHEGRVKVTDFGISRARLVVDAREFTQVVHVMGTPDYMAPELKQLSAADEMTDLYALGMTFWRMFAGCEVEPLGHPLHDLHPELPLGLSEAIGRCLAEAPSDRYGSVVEARDAILEACREAFGEQWMAYLTPES